PFLGKKEEQLVAVLVPLARDEHRSPDSIAGLIEPKWRGPAVIRRIRAGVAYPAIGVQSRVAKELIGGAAKNARAAFADEASLPIKRPAVLRGVRSREDLYFLY